MLGSLFGHLQSAKSDMQATRARVERKRELEQAATAKAEARLAESAERKLRIAEARGLVAGVVGPRPLRCDGDAAALEAAVSAAGGYRLALLNHVESQELVATGLGRGARAAKRARPDDAAEEDVPAVRERGDAWCGGRGKALRLLWRPAEHTEATRAACRRTVEALRAEHEAAAAVERLAVQQLDSSAVAGTLAGAKR